MDLEKYIIHNTTHNTYLCVEKNNNLDYFSTDKAQAKVYTGKQFAQFCCDVLSEQYPQFNFNITKYASN